MIPSSRLAAILSLLAATGVHALIALTPADSPEAVAIDGGAGATVAIQGNSFADMAQGVERPAPAPASEAPPPETAQALQPEETLQAERSAAAPPVQPQEVARPAPETARRSPAPAAAPAETVPSPQAKTAVASTAEPPRDVVSAQDVTPPEVSLRPVARPDRQKTRQKIRQNAKPAAPATTKGNSTQSARAGSTTGQQAARATQSGASDASPDRAGNALAANYPGQVMRRVQRTRRQSVSVRGSARVAFTIAGNGQLARVALARSSGSDRLDQVALGQIRAAAPFPPPPAGARRSFTLEIKGK